MSDNNQLLQQILDSLANLKHEQEVLARRVIPISFKYPQVEASIKPPREAESPKRNSYRVYTQEFVESDSENESMTSKKSLAQSPKIAPVNTSSQLYANRYLLFNF